MNQKAACLFQLKCIALLAITATYSGAQADVTIIPSLAYQNKNLSFEQEYSGAASNNAKFSVDLPMIYAGVTVAANNFFVSVKMEQNLSATSSSTTETDRSAFNESNLIALDGSNVEVDRQDITFTVGYKVLESLNLFVGYLDGETQLEPDPFCANPFAAVRCSRTNRAFQQYYLGDAGFVENQPKYQQTYTESGFYFGGAYGYPVQDIGNITFSLAYASMDGEYTDNANDPNADFENFNSFNYQGDTTGTSLGLTWTAPLGETSAYFVDIRRQNYSMEGNDTTGNLSSVKLETEETMTGLTAGLQLYF